MKFNSLNKTYRFLQSFEIYYVTYKIDIVVFVSNSCLIENLENKNLSLEYSQFSSEHNIQV